MTYGNSDFEPMRRLKASRHAEKRAQQRGVEQAALPLLLAYGKREFDGRGGVRYMMTADSVASLRRVVGNTQQVERLAGVYAVVSADDSTVIHRRSSPQLTRNTNAPI